jgi:hypothetical protein
MQEWNATTMSMVKPRKLPSARLVFDMRVRPMMLQPGSSFHPRPAAMVLLYADAILQYASVQHAGARR